MQTAMEFFPKTTTEEMTSGEIRHRLLQAVRDGRIGADLRGVVLGYCAGLKRPSGPSQRQEQLCRGLVKEMRRYTGWEDEQLLDHVDKEAAPEDGPARESYDDMVREFV